MLWRVRTTLPDRPGALAVLAHNCGAAGVNILNLQIFPGLDSVTDELVLRTPEDWGMAELTGLIESSGGHSVVGSRCSEAALADQATRYVLAARSILAQPASFPEVVALLFDAEADPVDGVGPVQDVMEMTVGEVQVQVRRTAAFTATELARGSAVADLVSDVLQRTRASSAIRMTTGRRMGDGAAPDYVVEGDSITAVLDGVVIGLATVQVAGEDAAVRPVVLRVDPGWQRRGIGTRLLVDASRLASMMGASEIVLTTSSDNRAVLPMVLAAGMRSRIRLAADVLTVRVPVRDLKPLQA